MKKRTFYILALALLISVACSGCNGTKASSSDISVAESTTTSEEITTTLETTTLETTDVTTINPNVKSDGKKEDIVITWPSSYTLAQNTSFYDVYGKANGTNIIVMADTTRSLANDLNEYVDAVCSNFKTKTTVLSKTPLKIAGCDAIDLKLQTSNETRTVIQNMVIIDKVKTAYVLQLTSAGDYETDKAEFDQILSTVSIN